MSLDERSQKRNVAQGSPQAHPTKRSPEPVRANQTSTSSTPISPISVDHIVVCIIQVVIRPFAMRWGGHHRPRCPGMKYNSFRDSHSEAASQHRHHLSYHRALSDLVFSLFANDGFA